MSNAVTINKLFSRTTKVNIDIQASSKIIWQILSDFDNYASWNSTIISIQGRCQQGEKILLTSKLAPNKTFKLKISKLNEFNWMVWSSALGKRKISLEDKGDTVLFSMEEKIQSPLLPLFVKQIPSFDQFFNAFADDLKNKAESI